MKENILMVDMNFILVGNELNKISKKQFLHYVLINLIDAMDAL